MQITQALKIHSQKQAGKSTIVLLITIIEISNSVIDVENGNGKFH